MRKRGYGFNESGRNLVDQLIYRGNGVRGGGRVPVGLILVAVALWSALAFGAFLLVDPLLAWFAAAAGPLADAGAGAARWVGLGREAAAIRDVTNVDGLAAWVISVLAVVLKPVIALIWLIGTLILLAAPAIFRRLRSLHRR